jgi:hypothetical protein
MGPAMEDDRAAQGISLGQTQWTMSTREILLAEIERMPEPLLDDLLRHLRSVRAKYLDPHPAPTLPQAAAKEAWQERVEDEDRESL